jgi:ketosteroid isomerase-like protein
MMSGKQNIQTVKRAYEAFGRGDVGAILDLVTADVDWASEASTTDAPWWGVRKGKEQAGSFFEALDKTMEVEEFTPLAFATTDDGDVLTVVKYSARSRETGKAVTMNIHHWWRFTDGKISFYRGTEDTIATSSALT